MSNFVTLFFQFFKKNFKTPATAPKTLIFLSLLCQSSSHMAMYLEGEVTEHFYLTILRKVLRQARAATRRQKCGR